MEVYPIEDGKGNVKLAYDRKDIVGWVVHVCGMYDESKMEGFFRTTICDGVECEQFTLLPSEAMGGHEHDDVLVQIRIYKNGNILTFALGPANIVVFKRKKIIEVELYFKYEFDEETNTSSIKYNLPHEY